ncbi:MAG: A24 family peptidase [Mycobacterium sp.]
MAQLAAGAVLAVWLTALSIIDIRRQRLPNAVTLPGAVIILVVAVFGGHGAAALTGAAALGGLYLVAFLIGGMGAGDVKLALGLGALTGVFGTAAWLLAALAAPLLTILWSVVSRARVVPHGPSMCLATALSVLVSL